MTVPEQPPASQPDMPDDLDRPTYPVRQRLRLTVAPAKSLRELILPKWGNLFASISAQRMRALQSIGVIAILILALLTIGPPWDDSSSNAIPIYIIVAIGFCLAYPLWKVSRRRYSAQFSNIFGWLPVTLGTLSYPFWYWYADNYGENIGGEFFHASADILPVLLLATIVDVGRTNELEGKQLVPPIAAVFLGELAALNALAFTDTNQVPNFAAVSASLVAATFALVIAVMADLSPSETGKHSNDEDDKARSQGSQGRGDAS